MKFKHSLRSHLLSLYVLLAVLSGIIVPIVSMQVTLADFRGYLNKRQKNDLNELSESLVSLYQEDGLWDRRRVPDVLRQMSRTSIMNIALYDARDKKVFAAREIPGRAVPSLNETKSPPHQQVFRVELKSEGQKIGTLAVILPSQPGKVERDFIAQLTDRTVIGAVFMIVAACALGFMVAEKLSRPVLRAAERAQRISTGEYDAPSDAPSGIIEMDTLTHSVEELGRSLADQERLRRRLMIDIAHELRTPLTVVKSQLEAFVDGIWEASPERLSACVTEIDRLSDLISDVECLTNLEGEILTTHMKREDMGRFLHEELTSFTPLFEQSGIALSQKLAEGIFADIDSVRFRHVLHNLLSNALRYTEAGGKIEIRLDADGETARIEIEDTGTGIKPADLPYVFDRFYRADSSRTRGTGGRGVGLAIAKAAVEAHGGSISVKSEDGKGSLFRIILPRRF